MKKLDEFLSWFSKLKIKDLNELDKYYAQDAFFKDPFNEFSGRERITRIFEHMFKELDNPRFEFIDVISSEAGTFLTWNFLFSHNNKPFQIHGSTHLKWDESQKIIYHRDYWDVGEEVLAKIPVIKRVYGILVNKLRVD